VLPVLNREGGGINNSTQRLQKVVEVTKEYKNDKSGKPVLVENIVQHAPVMRSLNQLSKSYGGGAAAKFGKPADAGRGMVERVQQNPDGSLVTTIEHMEVGEIRKEKPKVPSSGWCGVCL